MASAGTCAITGGPIATHDTYLHDRYLARKFLEDCRIPSPSLLLRTCSALPLWVDMPIPSACGMVMMVVCGRAPSVVSHSSSRRVLALRCMLLMLVCISENTSSRSDRLDATKMVVNYLTEPGSDALLAKGSTYFRSTTHS